MFNARLSRLKQGFDTLKKTENMKNPSYGKHCVSKTIAKETQGALILGLWIFCFYRMLMENIIFFFFSKKKYSIPLRNCIHVTENSFFSRENRGI